MTGDEMRDQLVTMLRPAEPWPHAPSPEKIADALLPVVHKIAADELRAAAEELPDDTGLDLIGGWQLRARADALDPS